MRDHTNARLPLAAAAAIAAALTFGAPDAAEAQVADLIAQFNVGAKAGMNLNLMSEPDDDGGAGSSVPGFVGVSGGFGISLEALAFDIVGLEVDVMFASTEGQGDVEFNDTVNVEHRITTSEIQVPVLLKAQLPVGLVKPFLGLGITFVNQTDATYDVDDTLIVDTDVGDLTQSYNMWTFALGAAIDAGIIRVPIEFRGMYQSISSDPDKRLIVEASGNRLTGLGVKPTWEGQVWVLIGVQFSRGL